MEKIRITHQREVILDELRSVTTHPTADELYEMVRQRLPRISLATVYRNLEWLSEQGIIQKIEVGGRQKRFDANTDLHYHIRCTVCGRVADAELGPIEKPEKRLRDTHGFKITGHRLEFFGICPDCIALLAGRRGRAEADSATDAASHS